MAQADTKIILGGSTLHGITSPREVSEFDQGKRAYPAALRVQIPVGDKGKSKMIEVPVTEEDLIALGIATSGALAFLRGVRVS